MSGKRLRRALLALTVSTALLLTACVSDSAGTKHINLDAREAALWSQTAGRLLQDDLWTDRDSYDAGHVLMAPLDAAFQANNTGHLEEFAEQFRRFTLERSKPDNEVSSNRLARLQYLYLASRFVTLSAVNGHESLVPDGLGAIILGEITRAWTTDEAVQWDAKPFPDMRSRVQWKLQHQNVERSYYRAFIDEELYVIAIAAEYRRFERTIRPQEKWSPVVSDILRMGNRIVKQESTFPADGWLFQVGVWKDHRDYAYAGVREEAKAPQPVPRANVAVDSSHSSRWVLWLRSLRDANPSASQLYGWYDSVLHRLGNQFAEKVLVPPDSEAPFWRMTNFMDGWNGLYRWNYATMSADDGYGPYELSGSLIVLWWGLLPDKRVTTAFCEIAKEFPLSEEAIRLYVGPNTTRERNPLVKWPDYFTNGFAELNVRLACSLGTG